MIQGLTTDVLRICLLRSGGRMRFLNKWYNNCTFAARKRADGRWRLVGGKMILLLSEKD